jgi:hypothetical protein
MSQDNSTKKSPNENDENEQDSKHSSSGHVSNEEIKNSSQGTKLENVDPTKALQKQADKDV